MAVELKISVEENCDSLYLYDRTGKYKENCNETGWCYPNEDPSKATSAEFHIYPPGETTPIVIDVYPSLPTAKGYGYEVLPADLGMEKFESGIWRFDYHVRVNGVLKSASCSKLLVNDVRCCLGSNKLEVSVDNFESEEVVKSNNLFNLFVSAQKNACLGKVDEAQKIIDYLYKACKCSC